MGNDQTEKAEPDAVARAMAYGVDVTLLIENLKRTPTERIENLERWVAFLEQVRRAGEMKRKSLELKKRVEEKE